MRISRPRATRAAARLCGVALLLLPVPMLAVPAQAAAVPATDVVADDERDAFVGTGGLVLPGSVDQSTRREVADCTGCQWRVTSPCVERPLGNSFDGQAACLSVSRGCQVGSLRRTWFRSDHRAWRDLGLVCMDQDPVTVEALGGRVREDLVRRLPSLRPDRLPRSGVVTGIPTVFSSGQPAGTQRFSWRILGRDVSVAATPSWSWRFPDGSEISTRDPGLLDESGDIRHIFRRAGAARVACESRWSGEFTVDGLGPYPIPGGVTQGATVAVPVGEGRALLTP